VSYKDTRTAASIPSAVLGVISSACVIPLLHLEHTRSFRPSSLLSIYFLFSAALDLPILRTLHLRGDPASVIACNLVALLLKIVLLLLETRSKKAFLQPQYQHLSPQETSGIVNRSFLWWLLDLHRKAGNGFMRSEDLYELDHELASDHLSEQISLTWKHRSMDFSFKSIRLSANIQIKVGQSVALRLSSPFGNA
jgi:ATP-binding cassette subfamily C (CFTR/MRP) protein 1